MTAIIAMQMPSMMFVVSGSPNITVPTRIAVMGSNTPSTDAFVAPMLRVAMARDAVDTIVGSSARPMRLSHVLHFISSSDNFRGTSLRVSEVPVFCLPFHRR